MKKKSKGNINPKALKANNGKTMLLSKCAVCGGRKSKFIKKQEVKSHYLLIFCFECNSIEVYKINEIVNKLAGDKFIPVMHLKQPRFTCSACGTFTENKERIQTLKKTGDTRYI